MIHTAPDMPALEDMDLHYPPREWPDYLLAPLPADERIWRSDNHYAAYLIRNPWGGMNPIAALAREMAEVHWEAQLDRDKDRPHLTVVQAAYQKHWVKWRDAEAQRLRVTGRRSHSRGKR